MAEGLDLVLATADPAGLAAFYCDVLGGGARDDAALWRAEAAVAFGTQTIAMRSAEEPERSSPRGIYDAIGLRVVALMVENLDNVCARLEAAGRRVAPGVDLPGRGAIRFARDPDGNTLELIGPGSPPPPRPLQVGLTVRDAAASCAFYEEELGLAAQPTAEISKGVTRHGFDVGGATLKLWQPVGDTAALPLPREGQIGIDSVVLRVLRREETARILTDPDGNRVEVASAS